MSVRLESSEDSQFSHGIHDVSQSPPERVGEAYDESTARLFAAAPDMLVALETALDAWRDQFDPPEGAAQSDLRINMADFMDWFTGWRESAVAAVAAAKGAA